ncbi:MAG: VWA domain-containing protein [Acidobacteriota bacterium]|jgi:Ca-activated chloride channel family protein
MEFAAPLWLLLLAAIPVMLAVEAWCVRRDRERTAQLVARALWPKVMARPAEAWRWVRLALFSLAVVGLALALAGPRWGVVREKLQREGVDVVLVVDTSGSMAAEDVQPNRFALARLTLRSLLDALEGDRLALVALEGEAYPLVPLTLDAGAVALFLDSMEPGMLPTPGTSLGAGLEAALSLFVDEQRANKVVVLVSDGEDLEGAVERGLRAARSKGVIVHTVGVGTAAGAPVPHFDAEGRRQGFKKDRDGTVVVSRLDEGVLQRLARETGGVYTRAAPANTGIWQIVAAVRGMEQKSLAQEYSYRPKERYQWPLGVALLALSLGLLLPLPLRRRPGVLALALVLGVAAAPAQASDVLGEVTLKPQRDTRAGRKAWKEGNFPRALERFQSASSRRPEDERALFNLADALVASGQVGEAIPLLEALGSRASSPLAAAARYNLGNALFHRQDYAGAVQAYRGALQLLPGDEDTRRNLELALRRLKEQQQQQRQDQGGGQRQERRENPREDQQQQRQGDGQKPPEPRQPTPEEQDQQRFEREVGMPRERAMQLLEALQQNEKAEHRRRLAQLREGKREGRDW